MGKIAQRLERRRSAEFVHVDELITLVCDVLRASDDIDERENGSASGAGPAASHASAAEEAHAEYERASAELEQWLAVALERMSAFQFDRMCQMFEDEVSDGLDGIELIEVLRGHVDDLTQHHYARIPKGGAHHGSSRDGLNRQKNRQDEAGSGSLIPSADLGSSVQSILLGLPLLLFSHSFVWNVRVPDELEWHLQDLLIKQGVIARDSRVRLIPKVLPLSLAQSIGPGHLNRLGLALSECAVLPFEKAQAARERAHKILCTHYLRTSDLNEPFSYGDDGPGAAFTQSTVDQFGEKRANSSDHGGPSLSMGILMLSITSSRGSPLLLRADYDAEMEQVQDEQQAQEVGEDFRRAVAQIGFQLAERWRQIEEKADKRDAASGKHDLINGRRILWSRDELRVSADPHQWMRAVATALDIERETFAGMQIKLILTKIGINPVAVEDRAVDLEGLISAGPEVRLNSGARSSILVPIRAGFGLGPKQNGRLVGSLEWFVHDRETVDEAFYEMCQWLTRLGIPHPAADTTASAAQVQSSGRAEQHGQSSGEDRAESELHGKMTQDERSDPEVHVGYEFSDAVSTDGLEGDRPAAKQADTNVSTMPGRRDFDPAPKKRLLH